MLAVSFDRTVIKRGETAPIYFTFKKFDGEPFDLSGDNDVAHATITSEVGTTLVNADLTEVHAERGEFRTATLDTSDWDLGIAKVSCELTYGLGVDTVKEKTIDRYHYIVEA